MNIAGMSITEIRELIEKLDDIPKDFLECLRKDTRKGVMALTRQLQARQERQARLTAMWDEMSRTELMLYAQGKRHLFGIDEVGRGPLAGPVVAAAVCLPPDFRLLGLNDSKKLPPDVREAYYDVIMRDALAVGIGMVDAPRIDEINILEATREAMRQAVEAAGITPDVCLIDAVHVPGLACEQLPIIGGDGKSVSIAAASVIAKVTRDRLMAEYARIYPEYGFEKHAGYATEEHLQALERFGPTPIHRLTFGRVKERA
ncbi:ribonuclease HII [Brevibacillus sp. SYP-B805]|uniref:ribonuclease HII n=1 Tax=Brevibacillus sp. SYP-B805 TaxID=1578199 RepID=UPI0013ECDE86|nr:ribonuclease HII [Brevibacillus sp. SYP-B805]NGQ93913.1 ribonuclease HII [Brevibacillus sp. SYP-B805]